MADVPIYGRICVLEAFRPPVRNSMLIYVGPDATSSGAPCAVQGEDKDLLFIMTERYKMCFLEYDSANGACHAALALPRP